MRIHIIFILFTLLQSALSFGQYDSTIWEYTVNQNCQPTYFIEFDNIERGRVFYVAGNYYGQMNIYPTVEEPWYNEKVVLEPDSSSFLPKQFQRVETVYNDSIYYNFLDGFYDNTDSSVKAIFNHKRRGGIRNLTYVHDTMIRIRHNFNRNYYEMGAFVVQIEWFIPGYSSIKINHDGYYKLETWTIDKSTGQLISLYSISSIDSGFNYFFDSKSIKLSIYDWNEGQMYIPNYRNSLNFSIVKFFDWKVYVENKNVKGNTKNIHKEYCKWMKKQGFEDYSLDNETFDIEFNKIRQSLPERYSILQLDNFIWDVYKF